DEDDGTWALVGRQPAARVLNQLVLGDPAAGDHEGRDRFTPALRGQADHRHLEHRRMSLEHQLDLARVDVVAARDDQLLEPAADGQAAVLPQLSHVAGPHPAVDEYLRRRLLVAPVAAEDLAALEQDFVLPAQANLDPGQGMADTARLSWSVVGT